MNQQTVSDKFKLLDEEEIAARRIPIEDSQINLAKNKNWHCHFCNRRFKNEMTFMKHYCEPKRRTEELLTPLGQAAYGYYREWMRQKRFSQPSSAAFLESRYYRAFINFSQMVIDANIAKPEKYISLMVEADVLPILWCRDQCYSVYLEWVDKLSDPIQEVQDSVNYLYDICERENVIIENVFQHLGSQAVINLVRQRRLSPWLLFCSQSFGKLLKTFDSSQLLAFNAVINSNYWAKRFETEKDTLNNIKQITRELGI